MVLASSVAGLFKWRQFEPEVILLAVGWYLRFSLSYRDVEELLAERGISVDHVTLWRWVQRYAPALELLAPIAESTDPHLQISRRVCLAGRPPCLGAGTAAPSGSIRHR
jgi:hypothetical protein